MGVALVALLAGACGSRLSGQQLATARARVGGGRTASAGSGVAAGDAGGTDTGAATPGAAGGSGPGAATGAGATGAATGPGAAGPAGASGPADAGLAAPAGGNGGATDVGVTATEIDLGNVATLGGPVPGLFAGALAGAQAYAAYQNSQGGVFGRKLVIKSKDDGLDAGQNKAGVDALIPQVFGFLGSFSIHDEAGADDMQAAGTPDVGYSLSVARGKIAVNFSPQPSPPGWRQGPLTYFKQKYGPSVITKVAFFTEDVQSAKDEASYQLAVAQSLGYQIVYTRTLEPNESNFQGDVFNMQQKGAKAIMLSGDVGTMSRLAKAIKDGGLSLPFANWGASAYDPAFISQSGGGAEGAQLDAQNSLFGGEDAASVPEVALFNQWLKRVAPGQAPDLFAAYAWASGRLLVEGLKAAGPKLTRKGLIAAMQNIHSFDDNGLLPPADPGGKKAPSCWLEIDVKGGKFVRGGADPPTGFICNPGGFRYQ